MVAYPAQVSDRPAFRPILIAAGVNGSFEDAGVGGSTPSLATRFQSTYTYIESAQPLQSALSRTTAAENGLKYFTLCGHLVPR